MSTELSVCKFVCGMAQQCLEKCCLLFRPRIDVELIPIRCKFQGYVKMAFFIKIPFTIFDWSADKITGNIFSKVCVAWYDRQIVKLASLGKK